MYFFWLIRKSVDSRSLKQSILTSQYHFGISFPSHASLAGIRSTFISFGKMKRCRVLKVHFYFHYRDSYPPVVVALLTQAVTSHYETAANVLYRIYINTLRPHLNLHLEILERRDSGWSLEILELSLRNRYKLYFRMTRLGNKFSSSNDVWYLSSLSRCIRV